MSWARVHRMVHGDGRSHLGDSAMVRIARLVVSEWLALLAIYTEECLVGESSVIVQEQRVGTRQGSTGWSMVMPEAIWGTRPWFG